MKKIISISLLTALVLTTPIYANTSKGNYIIINNESTDPYTIQPTVNFQNQKNINQSKQSRLAGLFLIYFEGILW